MKARRCNARARSDSMHGQRVDAPRWVCSWEQLSVSCQMEAIQGVSMWAHEYCGEQWALFGEGGHQRRVQEWLIPGGGLHPSFK